MEVAVMITTTTLFIYEAIITPKCERHVSVKKRKNKKNKEIIKSRETKIIRVLGLDN